MANPTLEQHPARRRRREQRATIAASAISIRRRPEPLIAIAVLLLATLVVVWARTRPGYDPYGWLVWGRQTLKGALDTNAAPSWKPLPYLFTLPYALFGHYQLWLWMITSVAISLSGVVFAARIAYRLTGAPPERRWAAYVAGAFAGLALLGITDYFHYVLSAQSDPLIASLCLGAIDCHLSRRPRWAFALLVLASLGRPEVWPFIAAYAIWAWLRVPADAVAGGGGSRGGALAVVRDPRPHVGQLLPGGQPRARLGARDPRQQGHGHHQPLRRAARDRPGADGAAVGRARGVPTRPGHPGAGSRRGAVGDRRDRVRAARLAGGAPLHVPRRGGDGGRRRHRRREAAGRAAAPVERGRADRDRRGRRGRDQPRAAGALAMRAPSTRTSTSSARGPRRSAS